MGVLDYVESPSKFLKALRSVVRLSAVVSFPSTHWFRTPFRRFRYRLRNCPVYFYNESQIRQLAAKLGSGLSRSIRFPVPVWITTYASSPKVGTTCHYG